MVYTQIILRFKQVKGVAQQTTLSSKQLLLFTFTWQNVPPFQCVKLQFCFIFLPWINLWMVRSTDYSTTHHIKHEPLIGSCYWYVCWDEPNSMCPAIQYYMHFLARLFNLNYFLESFFYSPWDICPPIISEQTGQIIFRFPSFFMKNSL